MSDLEQPLPAAIGNELVTLFDARDWEPLEIASRKATARYPRGLLGWRALGKAQLRLGKLPEATEVLSRVVEFAPLEADGHNDLGSAYFAQSRTVEAEASFRRALVLNPGLAEAHLNLGIVLHQRREFAEAAACHRHALDIDPNSAVAHSNLAAALRRGGQPEAAEIHYRRATALDPRHVEAHIKIGDILFERRRFQDAVACYQDALEIAPDLAAAHTLLGLTLRQLGRDSEAEACFRRSLTFKADALDTLIYLGGALEALGRWEEAKSSYRQALLINPNTGAAYSALGRLLARLGGADDDAMTCMKCAVALDPRDADAYVDLGNLMMKNRDTGAALGMFREAQRLRPLITWSAKQEHAEFSVVFLDSPMAGSTPMTYLAAKAAYDGHFHCVIPDAAEDVELLRSKADVVFNMICNADDGAAILPLALDLAERFGRPVVNHPRLIMKTDRETMARRLAAIPHCVMPMTRRVAGETLAKAAADGEFETFRLPLLVRIAGTHGGDDFDKCDDWSAIADFVVRQPAANYYLIEFVDYRSPDNLYRKYRIIFIDGEILPYHLAIHDDWKVHHFRTDMAERADLRAEEERFLDDMSSVFNADHQDALRAIGAATGLDYGGIDCGLDRGGRLVVFEANASMLVHDEQNETFAYKNQYIARIKGAFDAMLSRRRSA